MGSLSLIQNVWSKLGHFETYINCQLLEVFESETPLPDGVTQFNQIWQSRADCFPQLTVSSDYPIVPFMSGENIRGNERTCHFPSWRMPSFVYCYHPQNEVWGKVIFLHLSVILFTGGSAPLHAGIHPPPGADTPQDQRQAPPRSRSPPVQYMLGDTGNKRAVRILLECNLVKSMQLHWD